MYLLREIWKHIRIYGLFVKNCLIAQMEYRLNFVISIAQECVFTFAKLLYVILIYQVGVDINGLSPDHVLLFIGTYMLMTGFYVLFFMDNFYQLSQHIQNGLLDVMMTKPVSLQFMVTLRRINFSFPIPNFIVGTAMVIMAWRRLGLEAGPQEIGLFLLLIASGTVLMYALFLLPMLLSFFIIKTQALIEIADKFWDFNNMPMGIYSRWIQRIGTFLLPIFVITNFPVLAIMKELSTLESIWVFLVPFLLLFVTRRAWKFCLSRYSSASS